MVAVVGVVSKYSLGTYNNYLIYKGVFGNFIEQLPLYGPYPDLYFDMNHYGILFAFVIAPFAMLPDFVGLALWMICGTMALFFAIRALPLERKWQSIIMCISLNELYTCVVYQQFNIATAALIIFVFVCIEKRRESIAALMILLGAFVKIYGIISLAFFFFIKRKSRFIGYFVLWALMLFAVPIIFTEYNYVIGQYKAWWSDIAAKNIENMFAVYQNVSLLGVFRKISGSPNYSDLWIMGTGVVIFMLAYLRRKQYHNINFRMMLLASIMLFIPLFSSGSESCSYLMAMVGVGIWWAITPLGRGTIPSVMLGLVLFASFAGNILPREIYVDYFHKYALKAIPFAIVWLRVSYEMIKCNFEVNKIR